MSRRAKLALVFAACAAPFLLGWLAYVFEWAPGKSGNYGELLAPQVLRAEPFPRLRGKWVLVTIDAAACDAACERKLYYLRQIWRAQGKNMDRVERLWIVTDAAAPRPELLDAITGTRIARDAHLAASFPGVGRDHLYVVDPLGNLMMRFPRDPDASRMLKDVQRLLRVSRFG
ncbi:MAG: SCO family protein [Betaproteobacteria bacterium]